MDDKTRDFLINLPGEWYESACYGDQVPKGLAGLMYEFVAKHGLVNEEGMWEVIMEASPEDAWSRLFECIFVEGAEFLLNKLANAVDAGDNEDLAAIGLMLLGVSNIKADQTSCPLEHIMHPVFGGPKLFIQSEGGKRMKQPEEAAKG